jgi:hypothetical protein
LASNIGDPPDVQSSLRTIVATAESSLKRLKRTQLQVRLVTSLVTLVLVFFGTLIIDALALLFSQDLLVSSSSTLSNNFNNYIRLHPHVLFSLVGPAFLTAPVAAILVYCLLRWRQGSRAKELSSLIFQMRVKLEEYDRRHKKGFSLEQTGIVEDAFSLTDQILSVIPQVTRKRTFDSLLFGLGAIILALIVSQNLGIALIVGVAVGLYSMYETRRSYEREIARLQEQKANYERRKDEFLATL